MDCLHVVHDGFPLSALGQRPLFWFHNQNQTVRLTNDGVDGSSSCSNPKECRSNSKLPGLVELFLSRPLVTEPLAANLLKVTPKAVDLMLAQLGGALPRELTGRTRYRAWGIV
jgi:hypothetical protein